jgi:hypothetical protein
VNGISIDDGDAVKLTHDMQYLCKVMGVKLPFLPVHGVEEFKLYAKLVTRGINGEERMALEWVKHVDVGKGIYPKLPVHLRNHKERFDRNERARIAFGQANNARELMTALNHALCPNTDHEQQETSADTSPSTTQDASIEIAAEPQRHHRQPAYDQCWPPISQPERLLPPAASAYNDQYQSHVGGVRISCYPEIVKDYIGKGHGRRGRDNSQYGQRKKRHCTLCINGGISHSMAVQCNGSHRRKHCERFHEDGTPK